MGLTEKSFHLTGGQIESINQHFSKCRETYIQADEDTGAVSIKVEFEWVPGLGRFVTAHFDGEVHGCEIEPAGEAARLQDMSDKNHWHPNPCLRVYLDKERPTPDGWIRAYRPNDVIALLKTGLVCEVNLAHDLGDDSSGTGYDVVQWIEKAVISEGFKPPQISIHSANPAARLRMLTRMRSINEKHLLNERTRLTKGPYLSRREQRQCQ